MRSMTDDFWLFQYRPSGRHHRTNRANNDNDVFEGLPVKQWGHVVGHVSLAPPKPEISKEDHDRWGDPPMPRDSGMLLPWTQELLRLARGGKVGTKRKQDADSQDEEKPEEEAATEEPKPVVEDRGYVAKRWKQLPEALLEPEHQHFEFLAKRRKGLPSLYGPDAQAAPVVTMRMTRVQRTAADGEVAVYEVLVPEGQTVEGEVRDPGQLTDVAAVAAAPGTVIEGVGIANEQGVLVAEHLKPNIAPRRNRPPPKKKGGPGRGKKRVTFTNPDGSTYTTIVPNATKIVPQPGQTVKHVAKGEEATADITAEQAAATAATNGTDEQNGGDDDDEEGDDDDGDEDDDDGDDEDDDDDREDGEVTEDEPTTLVSAPEKDVAPIDTEAGMAKQEDVPLPQTTMDRPDETQLPAASSEAVQPTVETIPQLSETLNAATAEPSPGPTIDKENDSAGVPTSTVPTVAGNDEVDEAVRNEEATKSVAVPATLSEESVSANIEPAAPITDVEQPSVAESAAAPEITSAPANVDDVGADGIVKFADGDEDLLATHEKSVRESVEQTVPGGVESKTETVVFDTAGDEQNATVTETAVESGTENQTTANITETTEDQSAHEMATEESNPGSIEKDDTVHE